MRQGTRLNYKHAFFIFTILVSSALAEPYPLEDDPFLKYIKEMVTPQNERTDDMIDGFYRMYDMFFGSKMAEFRQMNRHQYTEDTAQQQIFQPPIPPPKITTTKKNNIEDDREKAEKMAKIIQKRKDDDGTKNKNVHETCADLGYLYYSFASAVRSISSSLYIDSETT